MIDDDQMAQMKKASLYMGHDNAGLENFTNFLLSNMIAETSEY